MFEVLAKPIADNSQQLIIDSMRNNKKKPAGVLDKKKLFKKNGKYNLMQLKSHLMDEGVLEAKSMQDIINHFESIIKEEPNILEMNGSVVIIGDIHGQYYDFMKILTLIGDIDESLPSNLLFLGDYVDRGANSVEVMTLIMALKINYPKNVMLLRGNHQSRCMTISYNFMKETVDKYNQDIYDRFMSAFDCLPLACIVNRKFFCVHGGISDKITDCKEINNTIERFQEIPLEGPFCDFIWSDPITVSNGEMSQETKFNESRLCSIYFGKTLSKRFLETNQLTSIIRAHEVFPDGYQSYNWGDSKKFPTIITVFSAPNYCGSYGNKGAIIKIDGSDFKIRQYKEESVHNKLHEYLEVFEWSIPEVVRVINEFTKAMMSSIYEVQLREEFPKFADESYQAKMKVLMHYISTQTDIKKKLKQDEDKLRESSKKFALIKKASVQGIDEKERLFNRSQDYFSKEHAHPDRLRSSQDLHDALRQSMEKHHHHHP